MSEFLSQLPLLAVVVATFVVGPAVAMGAMLVRRRRARARRRSPLGISLLRAPGHTLREQIDEAMADLTWDLFLVMVLPLMTLAVFLAQSHARGLDRMVSLAFLYVIAVLACVAVLIYRLIKTGNRLDNLRTGCDAEVAVGQELDQLMRQGAAVFHDFPGEGFNIDHVVVSPRGVFAVETKGFSKPGDQRGKEGATVAFDGSSLAFPRWKTSEPLEQAERQAKWLASWLTSATGAATSVLPVLALPGWYVDRRGRGNVRVYSGGELRQLLQAVGTVSLDEQAVRRVVHQVEQRCRDVVPQYRK